MNFELVKHHNLGYNLKVNMGLFFNVTGENDKNSNREFLLNSTYYLQFKDWMFDDIKIPKYLNNIVI